MYQKITSITQWLIPPTICSLCHHSHPQPSVVCENCRQLLSRLENPCQYCAKALSSAEFLVCGLCIQKRPHFDRVMSHYRFEEPLRTLLHEFKYNKALHLRRFLSELMLEACDTQAQQADCIIPIPLHRKRIQQRGFNQAAELAKLLARTLAIPCDTSLCKKIKNTTPQVGLNAAKRQKNIRYSFSARSSAYQYVLVVDDLMTTGSTANEMAHALKQQGVQRVDVWCCARAT